MVDRAEILQRLIRFEEPAEPLLNDLKQYPWDWPKEEPLVFITAKQVLQILDRYLSSQISAKQLQDWAENLECREDVGFEQKHEEVLDNVFFRIATPIINEPLTNDVVTKMKKLIEANLA